MASQQVDIDSITFRVFHEGTLENPLVVLSHALMANLHMWDSTVKSLHAAGFSTLRYDHLGHGGTSPPAANKVGTYHFDDFVRHIHALAQAVVPRRPLYAIIGCSMGGVLAIRYALMYPETVSKIISCDAPGMTSLALSKPKWKARIAQFKADGVEALASTTVDRWFPDPCPPGVREKALEQTRSCTLAGYETCAQGIMNYDYTSELGQIQEEKVLVLAGENDEAIGPKEILLKVARKIQGARYVEMKDVGHLPPMHGPAEFEAIMLNFLKPCR